MDDIREIAIRITEYVVFFFAVDGFWKMIELTMYQKIQPSGADTIIGIILVLSLVQNYRHWRLSREGITP
jgi:hypothetical protein